MAHKPTAMRAQRDTSHTDTLGRVAEDLAMIKLSRFFEDCIVSHVVNNQSHDVEIRKKDEKLITGICRIQVKSTTTRQHNRGSYHINIWGARGAALGQKVAYNLNDLDFFLLYVFPEAKFYVVPTDALGTKTGIQLYVGCPKPKRKNTTMIREFEKYLEAWWLIAEFLGIPDGSPRIDGSLGDF